MLICIKCGESFRKADKEITERFLKEVEKYNRNKYEKTILIRIPKSAGTSLLKTLSKLHKFNFEEIDKEHLFPHKKNIQKFKNHKKIILLRDPNEIKGAIQRGIDNYIHNSDTCDNWGKIKANFLINDFTKQNDKNKDITKLFEDFYFGWLKNIDRNSLIVTYDELISNPKKIVNRIEGFLEIPKSSRVILAKERYTKSKIKKHFRLIYFNLRKVSFLRKFRRKLSGKKPILYVAKKLKKEQKKK